MKNLRGDETDRRLAVGSLAALGVMREFLSARTNYKTWQRRLALQKELLEITASRLHRLSLTFHRGQSTPS